MLDKRHPTRWFEFGCAILCLLVGAFFRFHALAQDVRFHPDEALFSTFARSAAINGDWLLHGPLDKTPLTIYASALSMVFVGNRTLDNGVLDLDTRVGEFAARLPGTLASIVLVAVMYHLARSLYHNERHAVSLLAMFIVALSPFAIAFSATVFTDGLMLLWMVLSLALVARRHWGWSGVFLALGFASKQQALYYVPLILAIGWAAHNNGSRNAPTTIRALIRFFLPLESQLRFC